MKITAVKGWDPLDEERSFDVGRDLGALWDADADNVFILKFTYWFGL